MEAEKCAICAERFTWYWRWRHTCDECGTTVCNDCLSKNSKGNSACPNCHFCFRCGQQFKVSALTGVGSKYASWDLCVACWIEYERNLSRWIPGTRHETLRGCRIERTIGLIKTDQECDDPADVEHILMQLTAYSGGNSYVKFFWDKHIHHHEQEYEAGRGRKGNPYYKTRRWTTQGFTGHAVAVVAYRNDQTRTEEEDIFEERTRDYVHQWIDSGAYRVEQEKALDAWHETSHQR